MKFKSLFVVGMMALSAVGCAKTEAEKVLEKHKNVVGNWSIKSDDLNAEQIAHIDAQKVVGFSAALAGLSPAISFKLNIAESGDFSTEIDGAKDADGKLEKGETTTSGCPSGFECGKLSGKGKGANGKEFDAEFQFQVKDSFMILTLVENGKPLPFPIGKTGFTLDTLPMRK